MDWTCSTVGAVGNIYILFKEPEEMRTFEGPRHTPWRTILNCILKIQGGSGGGGALVNTLMNLRFHKMQGIS
jgi:hypothetical protein